MAREFIVGDVVRCHGVEEAIVTGVGNAFLDTDKGWIIIEKAILVRPFNKLYKGQFQEGRLNITDDAPEEECLAFKSTNLALSRMMEK